jgi:hypothetical protein
MDVDVSGSDRLEPTVRSGRQVNPDPVPGPHGTIAQHDCHDSGATDQ